MADTGILTAQYVRIHQPVASIGDRMLAQIVDWLVLLAYVTAISWFISFNRLDSFFWPVLLLLVMPPLFYTLLMELLNRGQTVGKMLLRIQVVRLDGSVPSLGSYLLRWLLWIVDGPSFSFLGVLVIILSRNSQRLGDLAAGTVVIKRQDYRRLQVSLDEYDYLQHGYTPRYPAAADLSLEQIEIIRRTLTTATADQAQRLQTLADKVAHRLAVAPQESSSASFLERILRDYQYYALEEV
ncbi:MAG: RDD family protein [Prevotella sp.]|nr:RDD family protein [Prevotella sp.]